MLRAPLRSLRVQIVVFGLQAPVEITPGLVDGMAWWYIVLANFIILQNALLASDAAVAFRLILQ